MIVVVGVVVWFLEAGGECGVAEFGDEEGFVFGLSVGEEVVFDLCPAFSELVGICAQAGYVVIGIYGDEV